jgi:hypothetical protein
VVKNAESFCARSTRPHTGLISGRILRANSARGVFSISMSIVTIVAGVAIAQAVQDKPSPCMDPKQTTTDWALLLRAAVFNLRNHFSVVSGTAG